MHYIAAKGGQYQVLMLSISQKTKIYLSIYSITSKHHIFSYTKIIGRALNGLKKTNRVHLLSYLMWRRQRNVGFGPFDICSSTNRNWSLTVRWWRVIRLSAPNPSRKPMTDTDPQGRFSRFITYSSASPDTREV